MERKDLIEKIDNVLGIMPEDETQWMDRNNISFFITTIQFIKTYIGEKNEFYKALNEYQPYSQGFFELHKALMAKKVLKAIKNYLKFLLYQG